MVGLATVLRKEKAREGRMRVLVLGLDGAGKSSVVARWRGLDAAAVSRTEPTYGFRIWSINVPEGPERSASAPHAVQCASKGTEDVGAAQTQGSGARRPSAAARSMTVWDIGGQQGLRAYWRNYFESTDGLVFVIDASAPSRLAEAVGELRTLLSSAGAGLSVAVLANKADLVIGAGCDDSCANLESQIEAVLLPLFGSAPSVSECKFNTSECMVNAHECTSAADECDHSAVKGTKNALGAERVRGRASWRVFVTSAITSAGLPEALAWLHADICARLGYGAARGLAAVTRVEALSSF